jgi:hypothetical protein
MSSSSAVPAVLRSVKSKVDPEVYHLLRLLSDGHQDVHDAVVALNGKVNALPTTSVTNTTVVGSTGPVAAGQVNPQTASYVTQQSDHLGLVVLQGGTSIPVSLNSAVQAPFTTRIVNSSSASSTLTPTSGTLNGSGTLAAGAIANYNFDGVNWWVN